MSSAFQEVLGIRQKSRPANVIDDSHVRIHGADPVLPTRFRIGETAAAALAGVGVAVADLWEMKTGRRQSVDVDVRASAAAMRSSEYLQMPNKDGVFVDMQDEHHDAMKRITQPWPTKDGRWVLPHFGLPNLQRRVLDLLGAEPTPESVAKAVSKWDALDLENALDEARVCGGMVRSNAEWLAEKHGQVLAAKPVVEIIKIGDSDPEPMPEGDRPLSGIRALDLTRILAGPVAARTLAEHGAEVLMVTAEHLPQIERHVIDTSHGKRSCFLDLQTADGATQLTNLVRGTDVFSQGYRPDVMDKLGFGPEQVASIRPGVIYVSISCYGDDGPYSHRAGWEQVAQVMTGIAADGSPSDGAYRPTLLPAAANDYTTGYLAAYGTLLALARRSLDGGSYHVRVSLCRSGMMIYQQGLIDELPDGLALGANELDALRMDTQAHFGPVRHLRPILGLSETPPHWVLPTVKLGASPPAWQS